MLLPWASSIYLRLDVKCFKKCLYKSLAISNTKLTEVEIALSFLSSFLEKMLNSVQICSMPNTDFWVFFCQVIFIWDKKVQEL